MYAFSSPTLPPVPHLLLLEEEIPFHIKSAPTPSPSAWWFSMPQSQHFYTAEFVSVLAPFAERHDAERHEKLIHLSWKYSLRFSPKLHI